MSKKVISMDLVQRTKRTQRASPDYTGNRAPYTAAPMDEFNLGEFINTIRD